MDLIYLSLENTRFSLRRAPPTMGVCEYFPPLLKTVSISQTNESRDSVEQIVQGFFTEHISMQSESLQADQGSAAIFYMSNTNGKNSF